MFTRAFTFVCVPFVYFHNYLCLHPGSGIAVCTYALHRVARALLSVAMPACLLSLPDCPLVVSHLSVPVLAQTRDGVSLAGSGFGPLSWLTSPPLSFEPILERCNLQLLLPAVAGSGYFPRARYIAVRRVELSASGTWPPHSIRPLLRLEQPRKGNPPTISAVEFCCLRKTRFWASGFRLFLGIEGISA